MEYRTIAIACEGDRGDHHVVESLVYRHCDPYAAHTTLDCLVLKSSPRGVDSRGGRGQSEGAVSPMALCAYHSK
jgi:hypothetical protein